MANEISYHKKNDEIECVHYKNSTKCYAPHTHTGHLVLGYVEEGEVCIIMNGKEKVYGAGEQFRFCLMCFTKLGPWTESPIQWR